MENGSTSRRTLVSGSVMSRSTLTSVTSISGNNSTQPLILAKTFYVGKKLGFGNFGVIRYGKNIRTGDSVAIKLESKKARIPQLYNEYKHYRRLGRNEGIPRIYYYGPFSICNALVLELLGPNLEELFMRCGRKFSSKTILIIAMQLIKRFEYIHSKGIIFRDVKPENFVVGNAEKTQNIIYMLDFGLAKEFYNFDTNEHIPFCTNKNLSGTARYMSVNTHIGYEQSRRDDLESLGHMLIYLIKGALPWQGLKADSIFERYAKIGKVKQQTSIKALCYNLSDEWFKYMTYVKQLEFYQKPDYLYLYDIFADAFKKNGYILDNKLDWIENKSISHNFENNCSFLQQQQQPSSKMSSAIFNNIEQNTSNYEESEFVSSSKITNYYSISQADEPNSNQLLNTIDVTHPNVNNPYRLSYNGSHIPTTRITSTTLNDLKKNQQNRVENFKSHSRKPTPSHFHIDKSSVNKKNSKPTIKSDIPYPTIGSFSDGRSCDPFDSKGISIWEYVN